MLHQLGGTFAANAIALILLSFFLEHNLATELFQMLWISVFKSIFVPIFTYGHKS